MLLGVGGLESQIDLPCQCDKNGTKENVFHCQAIRQAFESSASSGMHAPVGHLLPFFCFFFFLSPISKEPACFLLILLQSD